MPTGILLDPETLDMPDAGLVVGDTSKQDQALLLLSAKGDAKDYGDRGVGLIDFINADDVPGLISETRVQLVKDGWTVNSVTYVNGILQIDATR